MNIMFDSKLRWLPAISIILIALVGCNPESKEIRKYNVILIVIDTWRYDTLNSKISGIRVTPEIDAFAKQSVVFKNTYSQSPWTLPSFATLLTSTYPTIHSAGRGEDGELSVLNDHVVTIGEILKKYGYQTYGIVCNLMLSEGFKVHRGFDTYDYYPPEKSIIRRANETFYLANSWIKENKKNGPFFMMIQLFDPHLNYVPPGRFSELFDPGYQGKYKSAFEEEPESVRQETIQLTDREKDHIKRLYSGEVAYTDQELGRFLRKLSELNLLQESIVIITSDHGEEFWDHGSFEHGHTLYDELVHVPLIMHLPDDVYSPAGNGENPKNKIKEISSLCGLIDVMPTVLDILKIPTPDRFEGRSFLSDIKGNSEDVERLLFCESLSVYSEKKYIRNEKFKYIFNGGVRPDEFYDIQEDPLEKKNLLRSNHPMAMKLKKEFIRWFKKSQKRKVKHEKAVIDPETRERMKSLGYIQ